MYYSYPCPYCARVFYTFNNNKETAAASLYANIKQHLKDYNEDDKEHILDDGPEKDINEIYADVTQSNEVPAGGYEIK